MTHCASLYACIRRAAAGFFESDLPEIRANARDIWRTIPALRGGARIAERVDRVVQLLNAGKGADDLMRIALDAHVEGELSKIMSRRRFAREDAPALRALIARLQGTVWDDGSDEPVRVSAVLVADRLNPWTLGQRDALFIENVWARRSAQSVDFHVDAWRSTGDGLSRQDGRRLQEIFGVPRDWPETPGAQTDL